jgi:hypothetical protein
VGTRRAVFGLYFEGKRFVQREYFKGGILDIAQREYFKGGILDIALDHEIM